MDKVISMDVNHQGDGGSQGRFKGYTNPAFRVQNYMLERMSTIEVCNRTFLSMNVFYVSKQERCNKRKRFSFRFQARREPRWVNLAPRNRTLITPRPPKHRTYDKREHWPNHEWEAEILERQRPELHQNQLLSLTTECVQRTDGKTAPLPYALCCTLRCELFQNYLNNFWFQTVALEL